MKKITLFLLFALLGLGTLVAQAKPKLIGMKRAQAIASAKAPGLKLKAKELEHEKGRWIYSFEFSAGKGKIKEVNVDAHTGKIVGIEHENPKTESKEEKSEKKDKN